jgi:hypothetical protein
LNLSLGCAGSCEHQPPGVDDDGEERLRISAEASDAANECKLLSPGFLSPSYGDRTGGQIPVCLPKSIGAIMAFTVIWYGRQGIVAKVPFDAEKPAKDHAIATFSDRKQNDGIVAVEVRKENGEVVFSRAGNT